VPDYQTGHIKRDPDTGAVAIRSSFPTDPRLAKQAWLVATTNDGVRQAPTTEVQDWDDLHVVPEPVEESLTP
jgi:hypothetical protein